MIKKIIIEYEIDEEKKCLFLSLKRQYTDENGNEKKITNSKKEEEKAACLILSLENRKEINLLSYLKNTLPF